MLSVGRPADAGEVITVHDALETFTFRSTDDVHELDVFSDDVSEREGVAQFQLSREVRRKFDELALGSGSCLFKMALKSLAGVFL